MIDGKPYFPATECAKILGYKNPHDAISKHCLHLAKREVKIRVGQKADGTAIYRAMQSNYIPEGDLYRLIIRSKLPAAASFEIWVFDVVVPSIRTYGAYITQEALAKMQASEEYTSNLLQQLSASQAQNQTLIENARETAKKLGYFNKILNCSKGIATTIIAKEYGQTAANFNILLENLGIQFKCSGTWVLHAEHANKGYTVTYTQLKGDNVAWTHMYWTQLGRKWLYEQLRMYGYLPVVEKLGDVVEITELTNTDNQGEQIYLQGDDSN